MAGTNKQTMDSGARFFVVWEEFDGARDDTWIRDFDTLEEAKSFCVGKRVMAIVEGRLIVEGIRPAKVPTDPRKGGPPANREVKPL